MSFKNSMLGKIIITAIGSILSTILAFIIIVGLIYLVGKFGIIPFIQSKINIPDWILQLGDILI